jgi:hypothetical protein
LGIFNPKQVSKKTALIGSTKGYTLATINGNTINTCAVTIAVFEYSNLKLPSGPALDNNRNIVIPAKTGGRPAKLENTGRSLKANLDLLSPKNSPNGTAKIAAIVVELKETCKLVRMMSIISFILLREEQCFSVSVFAIFGN